MYVSCPHIFWENKFIEGGSVWEYNYDMTLTAYYLTTQLVIGFTTAAILVYISYRFYENFVDNGCNEILSVLISLGFLWLVIIVVDKTYLKKLFNANAHEISKAVEIFFIGQ